MPSEPLPSRTAIVTCLMRTLHTKYDRPALIHDDWADRLVPPEEGKRLADLLRPMMKLDESNGPVSDDRVLYDAWRNSPIYAGVILRTRYAEEHVEAAVGRGVQQYVILGAGLDSFGVRRPEFARDMHVFEIDHPASQEMKRQRLASCMKELPESLHLVPVDFVREDLGDGLRRSSFRFDEPAVISWLGVTVYLTREANLGTFRAIATNFARESELVFTYVEQRMLDSDSPAMQRAKAAVSAVGEPWLSGFDSTSLPGELRELGLELVEDIGGRELTERYLIGRGDHLSPGRAGRIARARVSASGGR